MWHQGELTFGLSYAFEPGTTDDGVAVHIPVGVLNQVRPEGFDWQVPGLRVELVSTLIRSLPKALRRGLVPVPETVADFLRTADPTAEPLLDALERELGRRGGGAHPAPGLGSRRAARRTCACCSWSSTTRTRCWPRARTSTRSPASWPARCARPSPGRAPASSGAG